MLAPFSVKNEMEHQTLDLINSIISIGGIPAIGLHIIKLYRDKDVKGSSMITNLYFACSSSWGIYFNFAIGLHWTFYAAITYAVLNIWYFIAACWYLHKIKHKNVIEYHI